MKIEPRQAEAFLKKPDPKIRAVVIYGNDDGLIAERAMQLAKSVCEDLKDPFRVVDIAGDVLKHDPARLADEFGAMSLMGGRRVVRVRPAGEEIDHGAGEPGRGDSRRCADRDRGRQPHAALGACAPWPRPRPAWRRCPATWTTRPPSRRLVRRRRPRPGSSPSIADALEWIVERLGGDRGQSRSEIDKLLLYKEGDGAKSITLDDALAVLGDTAAIGIDDVVAATFDGELVALDRALDRVFAEGGNPVQLVRAVQRHADQLHLVSGHAANGGNLESAMFKARGLARGGPVRQRFERHVRAWPLAAAECGPDPHP